MLNLKMIYRFSVFGLVLFGLSFTPVHAAIVGPDYPAPGGNDFSGNGVNLASGYQIRNYSNFDSNAFDSLYFGLNQLDYGVASAGLNGILSPFQFIGSSGNNAKWRTTTGYGTCGSASCATFVYLDMWLDGGVTTWTTDLNSIGLGPADGFGLLGAVADVSNGLDFQVTLLISALGTPINLLSQPAPPASQGRTVSSVATGFYSTPPSAVPVPAAVWLFGTALIGLVGFGKRRKLA